MSPDELKKLLDSQITSALPEGDDMGETIESSPIAPPTSPSPKDLLARVQELKSNPTKNSPPVADVLSSLLGQSKEDMAKAMEQRNQLQLFSNLGQAGEHLGNAFTPLARHEDSSNFWKTLQTQALQPVSDLSVQQAQQKQDLIDNLMLSKLKTEQEKSDPNSAISQSVRNLHEKLTGSPADQSQSASELLALEPLLAKLQGKQESMQARQDMKSSLADDKKQHEASALALKMTKALDSDTASSRSALGKAALKKQSAEAMEALTAAYKNPDQMDTRQIQEIARSMDSLLAGGAATVSGTEHLVPKTASGSWAKTAEWLSSNPQGANQGKFVERMMDTVRREKLLAQKQMLEYAKQKLPAFNRLKSLDPATHQELLTSHGLDADSLKQLEEAAKTAPEVKDEHSEAVEWAKAHPADPRAAKILALQGVK